MLAFLEHSDALITANLVPRGRDPFGQRKEIETWEKIGRWASISYSGYSRYACAQSNRNQDFLVPAFDFIKSIAPSVTVDRNAREQVGW